MNPTWAKMVSGAKMVPGTFSRTSSVPHRVFHTQPGRILPQRVRPGFFIFDRGKNLGSDRVLLVFRKLTDLPQRIRKQLRDAFTLPDIMTGRKSAGPRR